MISSIVDFFTGTWVFSAIAVVLFLYCFYQLFRIYKRRAQIKTELAKAAVEMKKLDEDILIKTAEIQKAKAAQDAALAKMKAAAGSLNKQRVK